MRGGVGGASALEYLMQRSDGARVKGKETSYKLGGVHHPLCCRSDSQVKMLCHHFAETQPMRTTASASHAQVCLLSRVPNNHVPVPQPVLSCSTGLDKIISRRQTGVREKNVDAPQYGSIV